MDMCIDMCVDMRVDICADMHADMRVGVGACMSVKGYTGVQIGVDI